MRILFAGKQHYDPGGISASTDQLATVLARRGHDIAVVAHTAYDGPPHAPLRRTVRREPVDAYAAFSVDLLSPGTALGVLLRTFRPEVIVINAGGWWWHDWTRALFAATPRNVPVALYVRDREAIEPLADGSVQPDLVLSNAEAHAEEIRALGLDANAVPSLIDTTRYLVEPTGEAVVFINPVESKGVATAFAIADRRPDIPFHFRESWILSRQIRGEILERAALAGNVEFLPTTDQPAEPYRRARVLLVPYEDGNRPRVVLEAQVSGIPVLARDDRALREAVGPGGLLVAPDALIDEWVDALAQLWDDEQTHARYAAAARQHARRDEVDPERIADSFVDALRGLLDRPRRSGDLFARGAGVAPAATVDPVASVILPVRNAAATIDEQLVALAGQTYDRAWELVVADNGSTDRTRSLAEARRQLLPNLRVVDASGRRGVAHARNVGIRASRGEVVLICDGDDIVAPDWLEHMVGTLDEHPIVTGFIDLVSLNEPATYEWWGDAGREDAPIAYGHRPYAPGGNIGMWRSVFDALGGFDEQLRRAEDIDFSWRASDLGIHVHCEPRAVLHRRLRTSFAGTFLAGFRGGCAEPWLFRRHREHGMVAASFAQATSDYRWLLRGLPAVIAGRQDRFQWLTHAGKRLGRIVGSARARVAYF
jgi:glycosyltransferase involved in cell wall biosynthesis/GT2 family glycosyltransferase